LNAASSNSYEGNGQHFDVAVIGGGQAGLAIGYFLRQHGSRFVILERASESAPAWRERWDSLTLFTSRRYSALPSLPFPGDQDGYATRDEVIAYLERYAETFELPVELNSEVTQLDRDEGRRFHLAVGGRTIMADQVVVATGPFQTPYVPNLAEKLSDGLFQTHAVGYREPGAVPKRTVLVVGGGNTGFQIAMSSRRRMRSYSRSGRSKSPCPSACSGEISSGG
jgi:putative flavoprotein involved in K+ transport